MRKQSKTIKRNEFVQWVADGVPYTSINDLPMIRQLLNDLADSYRKDGWTVLDWDQDSMVEAVRRRVFHVATR